MSRLRVQALREGHLIRREYVGLYKHDEDLRHLRWDGICKLAELAHVIATNRIGGGFGLNNNYLNRSFVRLNRVTRHYNKICLALFDSGALRFELQCC